MAAPPMTTTSSMVRPGRVRIAPLDGPDEKAFVAVIAPDVASARRYLEGQPMGSYLLIFESPIRFWKPARAPITSLSIMVRYRTHQQLARLPLGPSPWFQRTKSFIEWRVGSAEHEVRLSADAFANVAFYWREFMPQVSIKVSEICQDASLVAPDATKPTILVPTKARGLGIALLVGGASYPLCFNFEGRRIDVRLPTTSGAFWFTSKSWAIPFPWNITFSDIKDVVCMPANFVPKMRRASIENLMYTSAHAPEPPPADATELDLLVSIQVHTERIRDGDGPLQADLSAWLDLPGLEAHENLLKKRLDAAAALLSLQPHRTGGKRACAVVTSTGAKAFIVRLAELYEAHSIGLEQLLQLVLLRLDEARSDVAYLFSILSDLFALQDVPRIFFHNHGIALVLKQYKTLMSNRGPMRCEYVVTTSSVAPDLRLTTTAEATPSWVALAEQAALRFSHKNIAFVRDEYSKLPRTPPRPTAPRASIAPTIAPPKPVCEACANDKTTPMLVTILGFVLRALEPLMLLGTVLCEPNWPRTLELEVHEMLYWTSHAHACSSLLPTWLQLFELAQNMTEPCVGDYVVAVLETQSTPPEHLLRLLPQLLAPFKTICWPKDKGLDCVLSRFSLMSTELAPASATPYFEVCDALFARLDADNQKAFASWAWSHGPPLALAQRHAVIVFGVDVNPRSSDARHAQRAALLRWIARCMDMGDENEVPPGLDAIVTCVLATPFPFTRSMTVSATEAYVAMLHIVHVAALREMRVLNRQGMFDALWSCFLEAFYHGVCDARSLGLWRCVTTLAPASSPLLPFVTRALFPFVVNTSVAPTPGLLQLQHGSSPRMPTMPLTPTTTAGVPLLNLALALKPSKPVNDSSHRSTEGDQDETVDNEVRALALLAGDGRHFIDFVELLLSYAVDANDVHLHPFVGGRFAQPKNANVLGLDVLFHLPRLLAAEADILDEWLCTYPPWTVPRSDRLRAQERLLRLSSTSFSKSSLYFKEFESKAQGAFGTIYKCTAEIPLRDAQSLAIKLLAPQTYAHERSVVSALYNEVLVLQHLRGCVAAIQILDYGVSEDGYYIAMEYAPHNLKEWWASHVYAFPDPFNVLMTIFGEVCSAVAAIHATHVTHLDIKCENVLLREAYWPGNATFDLCMGDFGESFVNATPRNPEFDCLHTRGTEAIRSPEMLDTTTKISAAADIWALGCLLYELLTGQLMFCYDDWSEFYAHLKHSSASIVTPTHEATLRSSLSNFNGNVDAHTQVVCQLLRFILVRSAAGRPTLSAIQRLVSTLQADTSSLLSKKSAPAPLLAPSTLEAISHRIRIDYGCVASKKPTRFQLHDRLFVATTADAVLATDVIVRFAADASSYVPLVAPPRRQATTTLDDENDAALDERASEIDDHYMAQLFGLSPKICRRLWELHVARTKTAVLLAPPDLVPALLVIVYMFKMTFFGLSGFEAVKEAQRAINPYAGYTPSPKALAHLFLWEETRERTTLHDAAVAFQCFCGQCSLELTTISTVVCCDAQKPCALCAYVDQQLKNALAATYGGAFSVAWLLASTIEPRDLAHLPSRAVPELLGDLPEWSVYGCSVCRCITHAVDKTTRTTRHVAAIPAGLSWRSAQRQYYYQRVAP
ncbi:serine/threonine protein kinase [Saprolegnia diclina VS20]|uniref:non-specific serine/threonine protein kinase n=1 Tax=Saprolegnia diclina (strain VS20) TaxID=1156394 RepID=T0QD12_SAPDV|nr:serine/threonine protein kinase [Saprolegnia diclina VS20]EQC32611.1 serine/threonine protein kinase [Saprolegnia diclina VS20]|eukprot:XP_008614112.1 serine/threonine protein kinase [Saprolegnia diclina VS20]